MSTFFFHRIKILFFTFIVSITSVVSYVAFSEKKEIVLLPKINNVLYNVPFQLQHLPHSVFSEKIQDNIQRAHPNTGAEVWDSFTFPSNASSQEIIKKTFSILLDVKSLEGISYYSYRRKKYRTFITKSYRVDSLNNIKELKNLTFDSAQYTTSNGYSSLTMFVYQEDTSFGKGVRKISIYFTENGKEFYMHIENMQRILYKKVILVAQPRSLSTDILITRDGSTYTIYATVSTNAESVPIKAIRKRAAISLMYRIHSMTQWFKERYTN